MKLRGKARWALDALMSGFKRDFEAGVWLSGLSATLGCFLTVSDLHKLKGTNWRWLISIFFFVVVIFLLPLFLSLITPWWVLINSQVGLWSLSGMLYELVVTRWLAVFDRSGNYPFLGKTLSHLLVGTLNWKIRNIFFCIFWSFCFFFSKIKRRDSLESITEKYFEIDSQLIWKHFLMLVFSHYQEFRLFQTNFFARFNVFLKPYVTSFNTFARSFTWN